MAHLEVFNLLGSLFFNILGNPLIVSAVLFGMLIITLAMFKAPISLMLMVLIPFAIGIVLNSAVSNFIELPAWVLITLFILAGFLFSTLFFYFFK